MELVQTLLTLFFSITINNLPLLLWGILISSFLAVTNLELIWSDNLHQAKAIKQIWWGCVLGLILPLGRYSNAIVARRLWLKQVPLAMVISFFFASVTLNPIALWLHRKAFTNNLEIVFGELGLALIVAIVMAIIFKQAHPLGSSEQPFNPFRGCDQPSSQTKEYPWLSRISHLIDHGLGELWELGWIFFAGCFLLSLGQTFIPYHQLLTIPGQPLLQIPLVMVAGLISGVSPLTDSFIAADWSLLTTNGATIAFLMVTGWFDLAAIGLMAYLFKPKPLLYLTVLPLNLILLLNLVLDYYL
ncbi:MAG: hypothetical protein HC796_02860 [Synechococcaceae cyanobacterium RL_1_2]|nr:hypothetical protein [Synechococcaceae cyanobacterium RL_1_2]